MLTLLTKMYSLVVRVSNVCLSNGYLYGTKFQPFVEIPSPPRAIPEPDGELDADGGEETPRAEQPFASIELITLDRPSFPVGRFVGHMKA